jgi:hypothetical protein
MVRVEVIPESEPFDLPSAIVDRNAERQDNEDWLGPKDESDGAGTAIAPKGIAQ